MDFLDDILGLLVLTSPLWLIVLALIIGVWAAFVAARRFKSGRGKLTAVLAVFALIFLVLFGDELAGRTYFNYLCTTKANVKVYRTVELPSGYWTHEGAPRFYNEENGNFTLSGYRVEYQTGTYSSLWNVERAGYRRLDESGRVLGEVTDFIYWGGWLRRNFSPSNTATVCEGRRERSARLVKQAFRQRP